MKKILSIDGGGIRGILPARVLQEIEERTGKPISALFDLIAGTSTGGILALCLTKPKKDNVKVPRYSAEDIFKLYENEGENIFSRSRWITVGLIEEKYPSTGIEKVLSKYLGDTRISEALTNIIIPCYEIEQRRPHFFKSRKAKESKDDDFKMKDVARATSAAPTYFEAFKLGAGKKLDYLALIDGGVFANNPAMCAYAEATRIFGCSNDKLLTKGKTEDIMLVSIGTGQLTRRIPVDRAQHWGLIHWARPLLNVVFDGVSGTVEYELNQLLNDENNLKKYYRFQVKLEKGNDDIDDASRTNIHVLKLKAEEMIQENEEKMTEICKILNQT